MSVYVESCKKVYLGNGLTREWSYDFPLPDVSYMEVYVKAPGGTPELLTSGYLVDMVGKKVTYPASAASPALAEGWMLVLRREVPATQPMELPNQQGRFLRRIRKRRWTARQCRFSSCARYFPARWSARLIRRIPGWLIRRF